MDARKAVQILLVEDDARTAKVLARMLREDGFHVDVATDGALAVGRLAHAPMPDVLIADVRLPHVDGIAVAKYARSLDPAIPIILTTSYVQQAMAAEGEMRPPPRIFAKPYEYPLLAAEIAKIVYALPAA